MQFLSDCGCSLEDGCLGDETQVVWGGCELAGDEVEAVVAEACPLGLLAEVAALVEDLTQELASFCLFSS